MQRTDFGSLLNELSLLGNGVEIGVDKGRFSNVIINTSKLSKIYLIDSWKNFSKDEYKDRTNMSQNDQDEKYRMVIEDMKQYGDRVVVIRKDCRDAVMDFPDSFFDFIYIDANHEYEHVKKDIEDWYPKAKTGSVFSGHDYFNGTKRGSVYGVKKAVDEFCYKNNIIPIRTNEKRRSPSWYFIKK